MTTKQKKQAIFEALKTEAWFISLELKNKNIYVKHKLADAEIAPIPFYSVIYTKLNELSRDYNINIFTE